MMRMGMDLRIRMTQLCRVCKQEIDDERRRSAAIVAAIFGRAAYAVCPACAQEVQDHRNRSYRRRAAKFVKGKETKP
jgi:hypothetical protein